MRYALAVAWIVLVDLGCAARKTSTDDDNASDASATELGGAGGADSESAIGGAVSPVSSPSSGGAAATGAGGEGGLASGKGGITTTLPRSTQTSSTTLPMGGAASTSGTGAATAGTTGATTLAKFSFFVTSLRALQDLSGNSSGFGGDLRFGETGPGAGLRGADKICSTIAERSMPGSAIKQWRAFLSVTADEGGQQVGAVDRIGEGPWYDRRGRLLAPTKGDLINIRPLNGDNTIANDLPNENGVLNHDPDGTGQVDNHGMLTGSNSEGRLFGATATCLDWTTAEEQESTGKPRMGRSWPRASYKGNEGSWLSAMNESGCGAGMNLSDNGGADPTAYTVGSGGGYGGFYCFALTP